MAKNDCSDRKKKTCFEINDILIRKEFVNIDGKQILAKNDETREIGRASEGEKATNERVRLETI